MMMTGKNSSAGHSRAATKDLTFAWQQPCCTAELQLVPWHKAQQSLAAVSIANSFRELLAGFVKYCSFLRK